MSLPRSRTIGGVHEGRSWLYAVPTHVEPGGWNHEECELCYAHVGWRGLPYGYTDRHRRWLCRDCYERYAAQRDLGFITT